MHAGRVGNDNDTPSTLIIQMFSFFKVQSLHGHSHFTLYFVLSVKSLALIFLVWVTPILSTHFINLVSFYAI